MQKTKGWRETELGVMYCIPPTVPRSYDRKPCLLPSLVTLTGSSQTGSGPHTHTPSHPPPTDLTPRLQEVRQGLVCVYMCAFMHVNVWVCVCVYEPKPSCIFAGILPCSV